MLLLIGLLAGCEPAPEPPPPADDDDSAGVDDDDSADDDDVADDDDSAPLVGTGEVAGTVVDIDGVPVAGLEVSMCGTKCQVTPTDEEGVFVFDDVPPGVQVLEPAIAHRAEGEDIAEAVRRWTRFFDFVDLADGEAYEFEEPLVLYPVEGAVGPLNGQQDLDLLPDLNVRFDAFEILQDGPLPAGADAVWLGAVAIAPEHWPTRGLDGWTVEAAYGLAIWDLEAPDAFEVTVELPSPLPPDTEVAFLVADYTYGFLEGRFFYEPAVLDADGVTLRSSADGGLDRATLWLAASRP